MNRNLKKYVVFLIPSFAFVFISYQMFDGSFVTFEKYARDLKAGVNDVRYSDTSIMPQSYLGYINRNSNIQTTITNNVTGSRAYSNRVDNNTTSFVYATYTYPKYWQERYGDISSQTYCLRYPSNPSKDTLRHKEVSKEGTKEYEGEEARGFCSGRVQLPGHINLHRGSLKWREGDVEYNLVAWDTTQFKVPGSSRKEYSLRLVVGTVGVPSVTAHPDGSGSFPNTVPIACSSVTIKDVKARGPQGLCEVTITATGGSTIDITPYTNGNYTYTVTVNTVEEK